MTRAITLFYFIFLTIHCVLRSMCVRWFAKQVLQSRIHTMGKDCCSISLFCWLFPCLHRVLRGRQVRIIARRLQIELHRGRWHRARRDRPHDRVFVFVFEQSSVTSVKSDCCYCLCTFYRARCVP